MLAASPNHDPCVNYMQQMAKEKNQVTNWLTTETVPLNYQAPEKFQNGNIKALIHGCYFVLR